MKKCKLNKFSTVILILCAIILLGNFVSLFFLESHSSVSRVAFQIFETALMMFIIFIPNLLKRMVNIKVPHSMEVTFVAFGFSSLILGDVIDFYGKFAWWDSMLHAFSGILLGILGFSLINLFNKTEGGKIRFPALFVAIWVVCFALAIGACWEILEYCVDGILKLNTQQYLSTPGTFDASVPLVGHAALEDTMVDLILDFAGSVAIGVLGYFEIKKREKSPQQPKV